jgi:hypothetical protein
MRGGAILGAGPAESGVQVSELMFGDGSDCRTQAEDGGVRQSIQDE